MPFRPTATATPRTERRARSFFLATYCALFLVPAIACCLIIDTVDVNIGDFLGAAIQSDALDRYLGLAIFAACYAALYRMGSRMLATPWKSSSLMPRAELVATIWLACFAVDIFFYAAFGFGRAGAETSTSLSIFSTLMPKDVSLVLLLFINVDQPKRVFTLMAVFTAFALSLGWTGQFFTLFVMSLYLFRHWLQRRKLLVVSIVLAGIAAYPAIFSIKLGVRQGDDFGYNPLTVVHLASRLTGYPALVYLQGATNDFLASYQSYFSDLYYIIEPLLAIIPKSIFGMTGNITLEKAIVEFVGGNPDLTQFIWGLPTKLWFYWQAGPLHFIAFCVENTLVIGGLYAYARRTRDEFISFYLFFLIGMYVWAGDISTMFVSLLRILILFGFYRTLNAAFPERHAPRRVVSATPAGALE
ncbi:oligosaccharide repeat unit polymerase [Ideonella benzenivorans]|uniref:oligosaccharide repeat unit polymerase n=1 Tax=Ideonella benzenivorans TaxID=2831643 RepID=UPI001CECB9BA|nr:oligosaccharide repeat unit polymerase [Ideonella benzenivorans]